MNSHSSTISPTIEAAAAELKRGFETISVFESSSTAGVYYLRLNRPSQRNALTLTFFSELPRALYLLASLPSVAAVIISAAGPHFSAGIDLPSLLSITTTHPNSDDPAELRHRLRNSILAMQSAFTAIEKFPKPVVAEISGACIGGAVELAIACDIRCCDKSAFFALKEVDVGLAADLGALQRLPRIVGYGNAMDLALTGRKVQVDEAKSMGLVSRVFTDRKALEEGVAAIAKDLAEKSPLAVMGTKAVMLKSRDLSTEQGLDYAATWNSAMLISNDLEEAVSAYLQKRKPVFSKL